MSMDDNGTLLLKNPKEKVSDDDIPSAIESFPEGDQDRRCPRCKSSPNSMISMADGKWMCTMCNYPEEDRRNSDKTN